MKRTKRPKNNTGKTAKTGPIPDINKAKLELIERLAMLGMDNKEIAHTIQLPIQTFDYWIATYPAVREHLHWGRIISISEVVAALHKKATGFSHPDTHICVVRGEVIQTEITKHYPPDTAAAIFILKNKTRNLNQPWNDSVQINHTVSKQLEFVEDKEIQNILEDQFTIDELNTLKKLGVITTITDKPEYHRTTQDHIRNPKTIN